VTLNSYTSFSYSKTFDHYALSVERFSMLEYDTITNGELELTISFLEVTFAKE